MSPYRRPGMNSPGNPTPEVLLLPAGIDPLPLAGPTEVQVAGVMYHADAIRRAHNRTSPLAEPVAVLVPEPENPIDGNAVAVYVNGLHAGFIPRDVAPAVQPALMAFSAANDGRPVSCPCRIKWHDISGRPITQIVLLLDIVKLGIPASSVEHIPDLDRVIHSHWHKLFNLGPRLAGCDPAGRALLAGAEAYRKVLDNDYGRPASAWQSVEKEFREAARLLREAGDPLIADAWLGVARSVRYQKGHRDERIEAAIEALHWNIAIGDAWAELFDIASAAPHTPTLLALFRHVPLDLRRQVLSQLLRLSRRTDRLGNMDPEAGARLRTGLAAIAEADGDKPSITKLRRHERRHGNTTSPPSVRPTLPR